MLKIYFLSGVDAPVADATEHVFRDCDRLGAAIRDITIPDMELANAQRHVDRQRSAPPSCC